MAPCFQRCSKGLAFCSKLALTLALCAAPLAAQPFDLDPLPDRAPGYLVLEEVGPDAVVLVDGRVVDAVPRGDDQVVGPLAVGAKAVAVWPDGLEEWNGREVQVRVSVSAADTVRVRPDIPARLIVTSVPYGATVELEAGGTKRVLGATPLTLDAESPLAGTLVITQEGFSPVRVEANGAVTERHAVLLRPVDADDDAPGVYTYGEARVPGRRWIDYAAAGLAVAGAATAIYYKFEADALDDQYRDQSDARYSDPVLLDEARRLDGISLVGLGAMQLGVGVLAVRFVLR